MQARAGAAADRAAAGGAQHGDRRHRRRPPTSPAPGSSTRSSATAPSPPSRATSSPSTSRRPARRTSSPASSPPPTTCLSRPDPRPLLPPRRLSRPARAPSPGSGRPPPGRPLLGHPRSRRCPLRARIPGSGRRARSPAPKWSSGGDGQARKAKASAILGQVKKPKHRRDDLRVTMINRDSTCEDGARPSRFDRRLPESCRRRPCGGRRLRHGFGAWIVHAMCIRCACLPGHRSRRLSKRNPRLAPPRQPRLTVGIRKCPVAWAKSRARLSCQASTWTLA